MLQLTIIGNLGADAVLRSANGREFISFRVAHTERFSDASGNQQERVIWVDVTKDGNGGELLKYLCAGIKVYVTGRPSFRIYDSAKWHTKMIGVSIFATQIELCGSSEQVPTHLYDAEGVQHVVEKYYHCPEQSTWGTVLRARNLIEYEVNDNGFIAPRGTGEDEQNNAK